VDEIGAGAVTFFGNLSSALTSEDARKSYAENGYEIAKNIISGIGNLVRTGSELQSGVLMPLVESFQNPEGTSWLDVGKGILSGIVDGFKEAAPNFISAVNTVIEDARTIVSGFIDFFTNARETVSGWIDNITNKDETAGGGGSANAGAGAGRYEAQVQDARTNNNRNIGGVTVNQNIYSEAKTAADLMEEARYQADLAVMFGVRA
jgi:hypothetical protein